MCSCPAHNALVGCECQCDHTHDRLAQWHDRALAAEAEIARLRAGESNDPVTEGTELTPGQWIRRWNDETADERLQRVTHIRTAFAAWRECEETDHRGRLEALEAESATREAGVRAAVEERFGPMIAEMTDKALEERRALIETTVRADERRRVLAELAPLAAEHGLVLRLHEDGRQ